MPESPDQAFARLALELSETETIDQTAAQVVAFSIRTVGTQYGGVTMVRAGSRFETVGPSAEIVTLADDLQYALAEGPCVDAATTSPLVVSPDLAGDERWPQWVPAAVDLGLRSVLATELRAGGRRIGAINLYGTAERRFTADDIDVVRLFACHAAAALAAMRLREGLLNALDSRTVIGQAQGVLMERFGVDADRAFTILRRYSQDGNRRLTDVARHLLSTRDLPPFDVLP